MYFWDIDTLAKELREDKVSHDEQVKYYIAATLIYMFSARLPHFASPHDPIHATLFSAIAFSLKIILVIWGILYSYRFNKRGDDKDFQVRFVALSIPATVRYILLVVFIALPLTGLVSMAIGPLATAVMNGRMAHLMPHVMTLTKFSYDIVLLFLSVGYYWYVSTKIKYIAGLT